MATNKQKADENYERYIYARDNGHLKFIEKAKRCEEFLAGVQWADADLQTLAAAGRPAITINKILPTMASIWGEQLDNRADVAFRSKKDGNDETATALTKTWMHIASANRFDWLEADVFEDGGVTSRGFYDIRMSFDDNIFGEVQITKLNPLNVMIDPDAEEYDPDLWKEVFTTKWLSLDDIRRIYGDSASRELKSKAKSAYMLGYDFIDQRHDTFGGDTHRVADDMGEHRRRLRVIERQFKEHVMAEHFVDMHTGDTRRVPEGMEREKIQLIMEQFEVGIIKRKAEVIRWRTSIDDIMLHDEESPYKHFTPVPYFPFFRRGRTIGMVENLLDPQEVYNKAVSQELHVINTTANSGWIIEDGNLQNMTIPELEERGAETGLVLVVKKKDGVDKIHPNQVPTGLDRVSYKAAEDLKEVGMVSDSMRGMDRADVAAKAIMAKQAQGSSNFAKPLDNLTRTRHMVARNVLDLLQTFYTEERVLQITGGGLAQETEEITINQMTPEGRIANDLTVGEYDIVITTVPARNTFEESQFQEAVQLRELGVAIPDHVLVEHSHLNRKAEIAKEIKELNGGGEPTEAQQRIQELEIQLKELEAAKEDATRKKIESETALNLVRAQKTAEEDPNPQQAQQGGGDDMAALNGEIAKREQALNQLQVDLYEINEKMAIARGELTLKERQHEDEMQLERDKLASQERLAAKQAEQAAKKTPVNGNTEKKDG